MKGVTGALAIVTLAALVGCGDIFGIGRGNEVDDRRRQWARQNIRDYDFEYQRSCFCGGPTDRVRIAVRGNTVVAATRVATGESVLHFPDANWPTVDSLFAILDRAVDDADDLDVVYDEALAYPTRIDIDWIGNAIDDEIVHTAVGLRRVP